MKESIYTGVVTFVHHEKKFITIEYKEKDKKKSINCKVDEAEQLKWSDGKGKKKAHLFRTGDHVNFEIRLTDRGDRMTATHVKFLYNTELDKLLQKTASENRFLGFLKIVDDEYFVKELKSYLFFPLQLSEWEKIPTQEMFNDSVAFKLVNTSKHNQIAAELFEHQFISEYREALKLLKSKAVIVTTVSKITPFAVYVNVISEKINCKIQLAEEEKASIKVGDKINARISYMSSTRIVVEKA